MRLHGTLATSLLGNARGSGDFRNDLYESEVRKLIEKEGVRYAEDVFWSRTKNDLYLSGEQAEELETVIAGVTAR
ncbi:MAG TPA: hypothetical protein DDW73_18920 [Rhizobium sp.]|nr:hypothetical protein [Rhizobium sp.]